METYFNINFEFDKKRVHDAIAERLKLPGADYICVSDGVIMNIANRKRDYLKVINGGMFSICDSSFIPLYLKRFYKREFSQYCGSDILTDIVNSGKYRMIFLGSNNRILHNLKKKISVANPEVENMVFEELPFCKVEEFDYQEIAGMIENDRPDIIWISLGAPKQEYFMSLLKPYLSRGVMIAVGAAFNFCGGETRQRAPKWMIKNHLEFVYRLIKEPKKQSGRCFNIVRSLPGLLYQEWRRSKQTN